MVICRLTRPIQNLPTPDSSGLGWESKRRCSRLFPDYSFCSSRGCVLYPDVWSGSQKAHGPSRFSFPGRRRLPPVTPVNTGCLPADSSALPNYQVLKSEVTHPHFSSRFILWGKGVKNLRQTEARRRERRRGWFLSSGVPLLLLTKALVMLVCQQVFPPNPFIPTHIGRAVFVVNYIKIKHY